MIKSTKIDYKLKSPYVVLGDGETFDGIGCCNIVDVPDDRLDPEALDADPTMAVEEFLKNEKSRYINIKNLLAVCDSLCESEDNDKREKLIERLRKVMTTEA